MAGGLLAQSGRIETVIVAPNLPETVLRDYTDPTTGEVVVFERQDVCKYPVDIIRHPNAIPFVAANPDAIECRATVYGLQPAKICTA